MSGESDGFLRDTFHEAAISTEGVSVMVNLVISVFSVQHFFGDGHTNSVGDTLSKRTGGGLDTLGFEVLGMTGGSTSELSETFDIFESDIFVT